MHRKAIDIEKLGFSLLVVILLTPIFNVFAMEAPVPKDSVASETKFPMSEEAKQYQTSDITFNPGSGTVFNEKEVSFKLLLSGNPIANMPQARLMLSSDNGSSFTAVSDFAGGSEYVFTNTYDFDTQHQLEFFLFLDFLPADEIMNDTEASLGWSTGTIEFSVKEPNDSPKVMNANLLRSVSGIDIPTSLMGNNVTQVPIDASDFFLEVEIWDDDVLTLPSDDPSKGIYLEDHSGGQISGTTTIVEDTNFSATGHLYQLTFNANDSLLNSTNYQLKFDEAFVDSKGEKVSPINIRFTTVSANPELSPHGRFMQNTNACSSCHTTHSNTNGNMIADGKTVSDSCLACHDGTVAPRMQSESAEQNNTEPMLRHNATLGNCGDCHDPHATQTSENPNLLDGYFSYTHEEGAIGTINSDIQSCESCHERETYSKKSDLRVNYTVHQYQNSRLSYGQAEDFSLCFKCHSNSGIEKNPTAADVETAYQRESGHSGITARDSSNLIDGNLACGDCHENHETSNRYMLKTEIGGNSFSYPDEWSDEIATQLCLSCHGGGTTIYGIELDNIRASSESFHSDTARSCSSGSFCHGGGHAP